MNGKNFLIIDIAATSGGAYAILEMQLRKACLDKANRYFFCVSKKPDMQISPNVTMIDCSKYKNWLGRIIFNIFHLKKMIRKYKIDELLSLQNEAFNVRSLKQGVYIHQVLPYSDYKFNFFKNPLLWIYKNIIGAYTKRTIKFADYVIVQSTTMKNIIAEQCNFSKTNIHIEKPIIRSINTKKCNFKNTFFYPAYPFCYKNHKSIVEALLILKEECKNLSDYKFVFTFKGNENRYAKSIFKICKKSNLPVAFEGVLSKDKVEEYYSKSVLLFLSLVETVGLPLIEMQNFDCSAIVIDSPYAREAVGDYKPSHVNFVNNNTTEIAKAIKEYIK